MSVSNEEASECAARVARYLGGDESLDRIYGHIHHDELGVYYADNRKLIFWAIAELDRRERELTARAKPINVKLLADSGGASIGSAWFWPGVPGRYESGAWMIGREKIRDVRNHGDLLDVLKVLKGDSP